jgi:hypothetical protein
VHTCVCRRCKYGLHFRTVEEGGGRKGGGRSGRGTLRSTKRRVRRLDCESRGFGAWEVDQEILEELHAGHDTSCPGVRERCWAKTGPREEIAGGQEKICKDRFVLVKCYSWVFKAPWQWGENGRREDRHEQEEKGEVSKNTSSAAWLVGNGTLSTLGSLLR